MSSASAKLLATSALLTSKFAARRILRGAAPMMLAADAAQWATEAGGHHIGLRDPDKRKRAGRAVGLTAALGAGALAGPAGIAVASGLWVAGEVAGEASRWIIADCRGGVR